MNKTTKKGRHNQSSTLTETTRVDFLLLGGGLASVTAAETLRIEDALGSILIIAAEKELPYNRPPLSKNFLLGKQSKEGSFEFQRGNKSKI